MPELIAALGASFYPRLAPLANRWNTATGLEVQSLPIHLGLAREHQARSERS